MKVYLVGEHAFRWEDDAWAVAHAIDQPQVTVLHINTLSRERNALIDALTRICPQCKGIGEVPYEGFPHDHTTRPGFELCSMCRGRTIVPKKRL